MSLQFGPSCDWEQVAKSVGRGWKFQPNSLSSQLEKFLDSFNFNHSIRVGPGDEYNLICDLIHISHERELAAVHHLAHFPCPHRIVFLFNWDLIIKIKSTKGIWALQDKKHVALFGSRENLWEAFERIWHLVARNIWHWRCNDEWTYTISYTIIPVLHLFRNLMTHIFILQQKCNFAYGSPALPRELRKRKNFFWQDQERSSDLNRYVN